MADLFAAGPDNLPYSGTYIVSGDYKSTDPTAVSVGVQGASHATIVIVTTALSGAGCTVTPTVQGYDPASNSWYTLLAITGITSATTTIARIGPNVTASAGVAAQIGLPRTIRVSCVGSGTRTTLTYSVGLHLHAD